MTSTPLSARVTQAIENFVMEVGEPEVLQAPRRRRNFRDWLHRLASLSHQEHWFALCAAIFSEELDAAGATQIPGQERSLSQIQTKVVRAIVSRVIHPFEGESPRVVSAYARRQIAPSHNSLTLLAILDARMSEFFISNEPNTRALPNSTVLDAPLPLFQTQSHSQIPLPVTTEFETEQVPRTTNQGESILPTLYGAARAGRDPNLDHDRIELLHGEPEEPDRLGATGNMAMQLASSEVFTGQGQTEPGHGRETSFSTRIDTNVQPDVIRPPTIPNLLNQPSSAAEDTESVTTNHDA